VVGPIRQRWEQHRPGEAPRSIRRRYTERRAPADGRSHGGCAALRVGRLMNAQGDRRPGGGMRADGLPGRRAIARIACGVSSGPKPRPGVDCWAHIAAAVADLGPRAASRRPAELVCR